MFKQQTAKNLRRAESERVEQMIESVFPLLMQLQDGYHGAELTAISTGPSKDGEGCMALARVTISEPAETFWVERGYGPGHYVMWGHGASPWQAICAIEVELSTGGAGLVVDKYPPAPPQKKQKAPGRGATHKGSKPFG